MAPAVADPLSTAKPGKVEPSVPASVQEGMVTLQKRIEALKEGGTGVAPFQKIWDQVGELDKAGKAEEASKLMSDLNSKLSTLENLRDQTRRVSAARSVKIQRNTGAAAVSTSSGAGNVSGTGNRQMPRDLSAASLGQRGKRSHCQPRQTKTLCVRQQAFQLQGKFGLPANSYHARINAAEQIAATSPWKALTDLDEISCDMDKAAEGKNSEVTQQLNNGGESNVWVNGFASCIALAIGHSCASKCKSALHLPSNYWNKSSHCQY